MINCKHCLQALNPYLDRELSDEDILQVRSTSMRAAAACTSSSSRSRSDVWYVCAVSSSKRPKACGPRSRRGW